MVKNWLETFPSAEGSETPCWTEGITPRQKNIGANVEILEELFTAETLAFEVANAVSNLRKSVSNEVRQDWNAAYKITKAKAFSGDVTAQTVYNQMREFYRNFFGPKNVPLKESYSRGYVPRGVKGLFHTMQATTPTDCDPPNPTIDPKI